MTRNVQSKFTAFIYDVFVAGVDHSIPGNGGPECVNFIPLWQRVLETAILVPLGVYGIVSSLHRLEFSSSASREQKCSTNGCSNGTNGSLASKIVELKPRRLCQRLLPLRNSLFNIYVVVFAIELIYKFVTKTGIFLLNPCHVTTILQLILLKLPDSPWTTQIFRFHMYTMPGAVVALLFPILNTRLLAGETLIYFLQHWLIVLVPLYLMALGGPFVPESSGNVSWPILSLSVILIYHFIPLQFVAYATHVNLNCILCPAVSDPFGSRFWRLFACMHQSVAVPLITKFYGLLSYYYVSLVIKDCKLE